MTTKGASDFTPGDAEAERHPQVKEVISRRAGAARHPRWGAAPVAFPAST
jgi:hypothetical protein